MRFKLQKENKNTQTTLYKFVVPTEDHDYQYYYHIANNEQILDVIRYIHKLHEPRKIEVEYCVHNQELQSKLIDLKLLTKKMTHQVNKDKIKSLLEIMKLYIEEVEEILQKD